MRNKIFPITLAIIIIAIIIFIMVWATRSQKKTNSLADTLGEIFTLEEITEHNTADDCYTVVDGLVYDLSGVGPQHPGGAKAIESMCGIDASDIFTQKHGQSSGAKAMLKKLHIGSLQTEMLNQIDEEASSQ